MILCTWRIVIQGYNGNFSIIRTRVGFSMGVELTKISIGIRNKDDDNSG